MQSVSPEYRIRIPCFLPPMRVLTTTPNSSKFVTGSHILGSTWKTWNELDHNGQPLNFVRVICLWHAYWRFKNISEGGENNLTDSPVFLFLWSKQDDSASPFWRNYFKRKQHKAGKRWGHLNHAPSVTTFCIQLAGFTSQHTSGWFEHDLPSFPLNTNQCFVNIMPLFPQQFLFSLPLPDIPLNLRGRTALSKLQRPRSQSGEHHLQKAIISHTPWRLITPAFIHASVFLNHVTEASTESLRHSSVWPFGQSIKIKNVSVKFLLFEKSGSLRFRALPLFVWLGPNCPCKKRRLPLPKPVHRSPTTYVKAAVCA